MELIHKYFPDLSQEQLQRFEALHGLYSEWNEKINVISRKDMDNFYERHVLHSLGISRFVSFEPGQKVIDVGTGGGFPGIPLAILYPETQFLLVDSIGKKISVVNEVIEALGLQNARATHVRAEKVKEKFDFMTCRAVTRIDRLYIWARQLVKKGGSLVCLKGGDLDEELASLNVKHYKWPLKGKFIEDFFETKFVVKVEM